MTESKNHIEIVDSLRSLYPLQEFEETAVMEVVERFEELTGKEELFDRNNKMFNDIACDIAKKTRASVIDEFAEKFIYKAVCEGCSGCCTCYEEGRQAECEDWKCYMEIALQMKGEKE